MLDIKIEEVSRGNQRILRSIELSLEAGEFVAIAGENGAGKSTLLNLLAGELDYDGDIFLQGRELQAWHPAALAPVRSVMEQQLLAPIGLTVQELVAMSRFWANQSDTEADALALSWLKQFDLQSFAQRETTTLSGGELQRAHLARCFCQVDRPIRGEQVMLLDEPTSALDVFHQHGVLHELKSFSRQGNLVLAVMHDLNLVSLYADKVILLGNGDVQHFAAPEDVFCPDILEENYRTPVHVTPHPTFCKPMIFTEPRH